VKQPGRVKRACKLDLSDGVKAMSGRRERVIEKQNIVTNSLLFFSTSPG
jgi:hypothetical protein